MQYFVRFKIYMLNRILFVLYRLSKKQKNNTCAGIVFSKDRPLQLEALLNSYIQFVKNNIPLYVLYTVSNIEIEKAYNEINKNYPHIVFIKERNFRKDLIHLLNTIKTHKLFFLVDDMLFIRKFDLKQLISMDTDKYIPSLRMGKNITCNIMQKREVHQPLILKYNEHLIYWQWNLNNSYWSYPISVDGHIYTKKEIEIAIKAIKFSAPNSLEWQLQIFNNYFKRKKGCSFNNSVIVNIPWNKVQTENNNEAGDISTKELLILWNKGKRINIKEYLNKPYNSAHTNAELIIE